MHLSQQLIVQSMRLKDAKEAVANAKEATAEYLNLRGRLEGLSFDEFREVIDDLRELTRVKWIEFDQNNLGMRTNEDIIYLATELKQLLEHGQLNQIGFSGNNFNDEKIFLLFDGLVTAPILCFDGNSLGDLVHCKKETLVNNFGKLKGLTSLSIINTELYKLGDKAQFVFEGLATTNITGLEMGSNELEKLGEHAAPFFRSLKQLKLEHLDISDNSFDMFKEDVATAVFEALGKSERLESLTCSDIGLHNFGKFGENIEQVLKGLCKLKLLRNLLFTCLDDSLCKLGFKHLGAFYNFLITLAKESLQLTNIVGLLSASTDPFLNNLSSGDFGQFVLAVGEDNIPKLRELYRILWLNGRTAFNIALLNIKKRKTEAGDSKKRKKEEADDVSYFKLLPLELIHKIASYLTREENENTLCPTPAACLRMDANDISRRHYGDGSVLWGPSDMMRQLVFGNPEKWCQYVDKAKAAEAAAVAAKVAAVAADEAAEAAVVATPAEAAAALSAPSL